MDNRVPNDRISQVVRAILGGVSALSLSAVAMPGLAADAAAASPAQGQLEEIVVTGLRASLQKSMDVKKNAVGVVDAITSEDIGKFPDSNLAAAVQRIPGISVSRGTSSMGGVPSSTGDATEITVRGFGPSFNETLYDGRQVATGTSDRGFDFSALGADFVSEVNVLKTPDATLSSGAIGATINIKYPKPFDHPGMRLAGSLSASYAPDEGKSAPNGGILFSDTFNDTFGILADLAYSDHKVRGNQVNTQGWEGKKFKPSQFLGGPAPTPGELATVVGWFIQDYGIYQEHTDDKRIDGRLVLQWHPSDHMMLTLNDDYSKDKLVQTQYGYSVWFNNGSLTNVTQNANGTITNFIQPATPTDFQSQVNGSVIENNDIGLNLKWDVSDKLSYVFDAATSESKLNPGGELSSIDVDVGYGGPANITSVGITGIGSNSLPYPTGIGPGGNASLFINNGVIGSHVLPMGSNRNKDTINQFKVEGTWTETDLQLKYGFQYTEDSKHLSAVDDFANNQWQAYSGYGPAAANPANTPPFTGAPLDQSWFTQSFSTAGFIHGFSNNGNLPARILTFNPYQVLNYLQSLGNPQTNPNPYYNVGCNCGFTGVYTMVNNAGAFEVINENAFAGFLNASFKTHVADLPLGINVGIREERTTVNAQALSQQPTSLTVQSGDPTAFNVGLTPVPALVTGSNDYRYLLPNLDLNLSLTDKLKVRFDASRTLTRPQLNYLSPTVSVSGTQRVGSLQANGGNTKLLPFLSDNLDLGIEWYYGANSYASADVFVKDVTNFIVGGTVRQPINGVIDPTTGLLAQFNITSHVNGPSAEVRGLELAVQHVFGETGFGFQANATFVNTDKAYNAYDISLSGFAVTGLANSANLVAFYDKNGFQARVAGNWRAEYLDRFGQQQNNSDFGTEPTFVNANTQIDFSTSYDFSKHLGVYFEALNLNNSTFSTHGRFKEQVLDVIDYGRRYTLGVHLKL